MTRKQRRGVLIGTSLAVLALAVCLPLLAEQPPQAEDRPVTVTQGRDLPDYTVVKSFFWKVHNASMSSGRWRHLLRKFDVAEGSEAATVLLLASRQDEQISFAHAERLQRALARNSHSEFVFTDRGRHGELPQDVAASLTRFFLLYLKEAR